jgi:F-type H+-transporting ATPase subunit b
MLLAASSAGPTFVAQVATTILAFLIVLAILYKVAWGPILELLDDRRKAIADGFDDIDAKAKAAGDRLREYEEKLRRIDDEARERQNKAIDEGRRQAEQIVAKARHDAEELIEKTRMTLEIERDKARLELRREVVEMTLSATGKLLSANLDDSRQRQLVDEFVTDLAARRAS